MNFIQHFFNFLLSFVLTFFIYAQIYFQMTLKIILILKYQLLARVILSLLSLNFQFQYYLIFYQCYFNFNRLLIFQIKIIKDQQFIQQESNEQMTFISKNFFIEKSNQFLFCLLLINYLFFCEKNQVRRIKILFFQIFSLIQLLFLRKYFLKTNHQQYYSKKLLNLNY